VFEEGGVNLLDALKNSKKAVGVKQSLRAVEAMNARTVYIAEDADPKVTDKLRELCIRNSVEIVSVDSMKTLGKACGIDVGASAACILKS